MTSGESRKEWLNKALCQTSKRLKLEQDAAEVLERAYDAAAPGEQGRGKPAYRALQAARMRTVTVWLTGQFLSPDGWEVKWRKGSKDKVTLDIKFEIPSSKGPKTCSFCNVRVAHNRTSYVFAAGGAVICTQCKNRLKTITFDYDVEEIDNN